MFSHVLADLISCVSVLFSALLASLQSPPHLSVTNLPETEQSTLGVVSFESLSCEVMVLFIMIPCSYLAPHECNSLLVKSASMCERMRVHTHTFIYFQKLRKSRLSAPSENWELPARCLHIFSRDPLNSTTYF